jgi:uncharacterized membrane protein required for colicin V production
LVFAAEITALVADEDATELLVAPGLVPAGGRAENTGSRAAWPRLGGGARTRANAAISITIRNRFIQRNSGKNRFEFTMELINSRYLTPALFEYVNLAQISLRLPGFTGPEQDKANDKIIMSLDNLPINMFDLILVAVLAAGLARGRKHGMSQELLLLLKWLVIVIGCAAVYEPVGQLFSQSTGLFGLLASYLMVYILAALLVVGLFALLKNSLGGKLLGSDIFGQSEYYLGMVSGLVRFICIMLAALALLNARYYTQAEVRAMEKFQDDVYGSNYFPTLHSIQAAVFEKSLTGPWIKKNLDFLLIKPTEPDTRQFKQKDVVLP